MREKKLQKAVVKHLWIGDPKEFEKGLVKQQIQAPSHHESTLSAAHQPHPLTLCWQLICCQKALFALAHVYLHMR